MKKTLLIALVVAALAVVVAVAAPYSVDLSYNATNGIGTFGMRQPVQPTHLHMFDVLPESSTATISRVHGSYTQTLATVVVATGSGSAVLTNSAWLVPGDVLRISGPTNATLEVQGVQ
jgi:hypothetical protein